MNMKRQSSPLQAITLKTPWVRIIALLTSLFGIAAPALSFQPAIEPVSAAAQAFSDGDYDAVLEICAIDPDAENLALCARAMNTIAYLGGGKKKTVRKAARNARNYALRALEQDPNHIEALIQAAISDALRGGHIAPWRAFVEGLPARAKDYLDRALALDPDNVWALSSAGAWNIEVVRAGGKHLYDADPQLGYQQMARARTLAPDNISIAYETALRLIAFDRVGWREDALLALNDAVTKPALYAHEHAIQERALAFQQALRAGPEAERLFIDGQS